MSVALVSRDPHSNSSTKCASLLARFNGVPLPDVLTPYVGIAVKQCL